MEKGISNRGNRKVHGIFEEQSVVTRGKDITGNKDGKVSWDQIMR